MLNSPRRLSILTPGQPVSRYYSVTNNSVTKLLSYLFGAIFSVWEYDAFLRWRENSESTLEIWRFEAGHCFHNNLFIQEENSLFFRRRVAKQFYRA